MFRKPALLLAALCSNATAAYAGDKPIYQPAPTWVVKAPDPQFAKLTDKDPVVVLLDQQQRLSDGEVWVYIDQAMRVVSPQMMSEIGQLKLPWQPDAGDLIVHRAEIVRGTEHIDLLAAGKTFQVLQREEQLEQRQINGTLTATMAVEGLRIGDVVRLSYSTTNRDKALQGNVQAQLGLIADPMRAGFARARLSWPAATPLVWRSYVDGLTPKVVRRDGFDEIEVALPLAKQPDLPDDAPPRFRKLQLLEATSFADWGAVSRVMAPLYDAAGLIVAGSPLHGEVAKIAAKSSDSRVRTALALRLVQDEIRYLFRGMDGGNYVPQKPADTWSLRYGDCKAKTLLLLAMLRELGVEAEAVAANINLGDQLPLRLPSAGAFDHVLVRASVGGKTLWLDGTGNGSRLADLDDTPPFRHVLPLRSAGATLMALPPRAPARAFMEIDIEIDQRAGLSLPVPYRLSMTTHGPMAEMLYTVSTQANKEQLAEFAATTVTPIIGESQISERSISYDAENATATLKVSGVRSTGWKFSEGRYRTVLDKTVDGFNFDPDRARAAWKDIAVAGGPPLSSVYRLRLRLPAEGTGFALEGDETLPHLVAGNLIKRTARVADGWITLEDRAESAGEDVPAADIAATRARVALAKTRLLTAVAPETYPTRWKTVMHARGTDAFAPLLAAFAKGIADDPKIANGYQNRAAFYLGIWDWKNAAADYDRAIAIEPAVHLYLSRALARSALKNDAGALADAEAALALDSRSDAALQRIATYKAEHGKLDEGLAMLAERAATGGKDERQTYLSAQAQMLADAGRAEDGVALLDPLITKSPGNADLLNSRCWIKGIGNVSLDTGLKDCTKSIELSETPAAALDSRAMIYFRMNRLDEALADLDAALVISPGQSSSLFLRGVIRNRAGDARGAEDLAAARMMSPRIDEEYARYGIKP